MIPSEKKVAAKEINLKTHLDCIVSVEIHRYSEYISRSRFVFQQIFIRNENKKEMQTTRAISLRIQIFGCFQT